MSRGGGGGGRGRGRGGAGGGDEPSRQRSRGHGVRGYQRAEAEEREALERRWYRRREDAPAFEALVTARGQKAEPFHRWIHYRQGFAPELVRRFLAEGALAPGPVLDPFAGSGTTVIEAARQGAAAIGIDAEEALTFAASAAFGPPPGAVADLALPFAAEVRGLEAEMRALAARLSTAVEGEPPLLRPGAGEGASPLASQPGRDAAPEERAARAALVIAVARTLRADGSRRHDLEGGLAPLFAETLAWMREDLRRPLRAPGLLLAGDARRLPLAAGSCGGALFSPPYISRFDYQRVVSPLDRALGALRAAARAGGPGGAGGAGGSDETVEMVDVPDLDTPDARAHVRPAGAGPAARGEREAAAPPGAAASAQLPAFRKGRAPLSTRGATRAAPPHPAALEVAERLRERGRNKAGQLALAYFDGLAASAAELARVLRADAPVWVAIGGALLFDVYVPADLIYAELLEGAGFEVESIRVARELAHSTGKRLGALEHNVRPREVLIAARLPSASRRR